MPGRKKKDPQKLLIGTILEAMKDKIAKNPVVLDFSKIKSTVCDAFVICHGNSRTQVDAIAQYVIEEVKKATGLNPWHKEGFENAEWILIDYGDVVIHIFQEERRKFYNLERLWGDANTILMETTE
ncbi:MAG: ribosome silencing factor [Bacteroidales bacterium]|nr:ribosome silencing factor [Bacteroidales bacterium]MDD4602686.1 ribosome silencing factor [Bacteroidales bacterium]